MSNLRGKVLGWTISIIVTTGFLTAANIEHGTDDAQNMTI